MRAAAVAAVCLAGCGDGAPRVEGEPVAYEAVRGGPAGYCFGREANGVVHGAGELRQRVQHHPRCVELADSVDFAGQAVLIYALGMRPYGTEVKLNQLVREPDGTLAASITVSGFRPGCSQPAAMENPLLLVRVPASSDSARFVVKHRSRRC